MADFVDGFAPALAFEQQACNRDDQPRRCSGVAISMNHPARYMNARWCPPAGLNEPTLGSTRCTRAIVP